MHDDMKVFEQRRSRVLEQLGSSGALILAATPELHVGSDGELRYFVDPNLYYLTGYEEPEAVLVLCPAWQEAPFTLFVRPRDAERELWSGVRGGVEAAEQRFGADRGVAIGELGTALPRMLQDVDHIYYRLGSSETLDREVRQLLASGRARRPRQGHGAHTLSDPGLVLDELRLRKDAGEIELIRRACDTAIAAFLDLRDVIRPGAGEWEVEAALEAGFRRRGASGPSFPTIVGSGVNATVLHYVSNRSTMAAGDVLLVDAGARQDMYCSDITRSYPVSGRFTAEQRALYDVVLRAHDAAVAAARPGELFITVHDAAVAALVDGLVQLGFIQGDPAELAAGGEAYKPFFPHRTSHWLGLDVHDVGLYVDGTASRRLEPGMVLTIEPGLYIPQGEGTGPAALRGTGIRLESDVLVTATGPDVLTSGLPLDPEALFG